MTVVLELLRGGGTGGGDCGLGRRDNRPDAAHTRPSTLHGRSRSWPAAAFIRKLDLGPGAAQAGDDAPDLLQSTGGGIDVGRSQQGREQMAAAKDVEGQIAVASVVAVEEAVLFLPVEGIVGGVEVENDLIGALGVGLARTVPPRGLARPRGRGR